MPQPGSLTGEAHKRFTLVATLLSLIDPVRGEATVHSLDRHPHDGSWRQEHLQKKFLDSFALTCSTSSKGGETASAVCLEQCHPLGAVLRVARNEGMAANLVDRLQQILDSLSEVALGRVSAKEQEPKILNRILELTHDKIRSILKRLDNPDIHQAVNQGMESLKEDKIWLDDAEGAAFKHWVTNLPVLVAFDPDTDLALLAAHIGWASQAKWVYSEYIERLLCPHGEELPSWINNIYKLGRYYAAVKAMLKLATTQPVLVSSMHVEAIDAPEQVRFSVMDDKNALIKVLARLTKSDHQELLQQLGKIWLTGDPESRFRNACRLTLTVHAEMQLLSFYDHRPELTPRPLFIGTSKKTCFLCHRFLSRHPLAMGTSATHHKLYPSWMPAPCSIAAVRKQHKALLWELSRHLEETTARDLETRLGIRRPRTLDSTAGPSLSSAGGISSTWWAEELSIRPAQRDGAT